MLDINFIRNHQKAVVDSTKAKGYQVDFAKLFQLDDERKKLLQTTEQLRQQRNQLSAQMKDGKPPADLIAKGQAIKAELTTKEQELKAVEQNFYSILHQVPNLILEDVPLGGEEDGTEIKTWGTPKDSGIDHLDYAVERDWLDFERGAKVAGNKFYYLKNELALLENALIQFGIKKILDKGFTFMTVPDLVSSRVLEGAGFNPRTSEQSDDYYIEGEDLALIATAELPLTGYHMDEIIDEKDLPLLYAGLSPCFRKEAGTYGKYTRGLFRVHQFNKLEMYVFCLPERSKEMHEYLLRIEEEVWQELNIPYRIINIAAGDLGAPAAKKYDIEYWSPVDQKYREITSCSNCTDYQARNLNIRVRRTDGQIEVLHTLNGTAISLARTLVAIIENYAREDGKLILPKVLRPYFNHKEVI